jgi:glutathione S-transferase
MGSTHEFEEPQMSAADRVTLYYSPQSRATGTRILLEELGAPYDLHVLNMKAGEQRQPAYLAINPMGKVPAILHRDALVTEQVAVTLYLADLFPRAGLAPAIDDSRRGPYLRWIAFYGSAFEPAVIDKSMKREPTSASMSPYSDYDTMLRTLEAQLASGPYLLGDQMTAADILWGVALGWTMRFGLVPKSDLFTRYSGRITSRPAYQRITAEDAAMAAQHEAAARK